MTYLFKILKVVLQAIRITLHKGLHRLLVPMSASVFFGLSIFIPIAFVPGNTLSFQLSVMSQADYLLLAILSFLSALLLSMQLDIFVFDEKAKGISSAGKGGVSVLSSLLAGVTVASCGCSIGILLGLVGLGGGSIFVASHKVYIMVSMIGIVCIALYVTARRRMGTCATCLVDV